MLKNIIKSTLNTFGYTIEKIDPLEASIPAAYNRSPFLPRIYRQYLNRLMYFRDQLESIHDIDGDIVECGVSIGHGALFFMLLGEFIGRERTYYGFDSFEGFPNPAAMDETTPIKQQGFWANPPDTVLRVLRDGRVSEDAIRNKVRLIKGLFDQTVPSYQGQIALLHLDCDLYESYKFCLESLYDKVQAGGLIMFDEYNDDRWPGANKAIEGFFSDRLEKIEKHPYDSKYFCRKI